MTTAKTSNTVPEPFLRHLLRRVPVVATPGRATAKRNWLMRYGSAVVATAVAAALRYLLVEYGQLSAPYITFYPAITAVAAVAGLGPGILATLLSALCVMYSFLAPAGSFQISRSGDAVGLALFILAGAGISMLAGALQKGKQRAAQQAALIDAVQDAILVRDFDGKIRFWNRGAQITYGWTLQETLGRASHELLKTQFPIPVEEIECEVRNKGIWEGELVNQTRKGNSIVVSSRWTLGKDENENPQAMLEVNRDITDRKQAEQALQKALLYTRTLIEASLDPLVTISREGKITDVNEATERVTGRSRNQLIGSDFCDYFTEPHRARQGYEKVFAAGFVRDYPLAIRDVSGQTTDVLYNATLFKNEQGQVEGVFAAARDVTERKRAEEALRKASLYTRSLIEASPDPLVTISCEGKITDVNKATERVTGRSRNQLIGSDFCDYFTEPEQARQGYEKVFAAGLVRDYPLAIRHESGQITDVLYNASVFRDEQGGVEGVFAAARDITDRRKAEDEVRKLNEELEQRVAARTQELQAVNKELEAFNYAVAHDLRAPLRHIHGFAEILTEEAAPVLDESAQHSLQMIGDSVRYMEHLLEDLLNLSRLGRQELSKQICGLQVLVEEIVDTLKPELKERDVQWHIGELPFVECDPALMRQVITNLLTNALKFTRPRQPAIIEIGQILQDGEPVVFVRDNGVGFSMKYADKLFGLFQRLHRQQDFEGTGVGLAIVQRIIHRHGGRVWVEADLNKGATFYFTLQCSSMKSGVNSVTRVT